MPAARVLCVDDDPQIREMLPLILRMHDYEVECAATVSEALALITSHTFDVLIADLNMGHVADGFTVVSAMRRINPKCVNFILTGFPAFESALQALRAQVDDYLTKPSDIPKLVEAIERKLQGRAPRATHPTQRLSEIIRDHIGDILARSLVATKAHPELASIPLSDIERTDQLGLMLRELTNHLDSGQPNEGSESLLRSARHRGELRRAQQYPIELMIEQERVIEQVINNVIYEHLLSVNLSYLLLDWTKLNDALLLQLKESVREYMRSARAAF